MTDRDVPLDPCGCCEGVSGLTPVAVENRPGLSALAYRAGTHGTFKRTMLAGLSRQGALRGMTTREDEDPAIALVDAWSTVLDVLTFYEERMANEGFLRTAREPRSVLELARAIGYEPNPGVAASTYLAFELETAEGAPFSVSIGVGTKVQSVPAPGETPQTFETVEAIEARPPWNSLRPRMARRWVPRADATEVHLSGTATGLRRGDAILLVGSEREGWAGSEQWDFRKVKTVEADPDHGVTRVTWDDGLGWKKGGRSVKPAEKNVRFHALRQRAALFGHNAPDWRAMPPDVQTAYQEGFSASRDSDWPGLSIRFVGTDGTTENPPRTIYLDAVYPKVVPGSWLVLSSPDYDELYRADPKLGREAAFEDSRTDFTLSAKVTRVTLEGENLAIFDRRLRETAVFAESEEIPIAESPIAEPIQGGTIALDALVEGLERGRAVVVGGRRPRVRVANGVDLRGTGKDGPVPLGPRDELHVMAPFTEDPVAETRTWLLRTLDGAEITVTAPTRDLLPVPAAEEDEVLSEIALVDEAGSDPEDPERTLLKLAQPLKRAYDRSSTTIAANVAPATHGETQREVVGSGDSSQPFQHFALKQSPLTHVSAPTPSGGETTLELRVNDVAWRERPTLLGLGPRDRAYVVRIAEDGKISVEFGDGRTGARVPTGAANVTASYRVGTGTGGNVNARQLSQLLTRPLGVRGAVNPLPASGGADPESRDETRENAPQTVLTFNRVVSLRDYEDFARSFSGIAKARAAWLWEGQTRLVHLTVAGVGGEAVAEGSPTRVNLTAAIRAAGDPHQPFQIESYLPLTFDLDAGVFLEPGYLWEKVHPAVTEALRAAFSFERRDLAQPVTSSEVVAVVHGVEGVLAVDVNVLNVTGEPPPEDRVLSAEGARREGGVIRPAQLLTVNPSAAGIVLTVRS